jgi:hypothetical protein
MTTETCPHCGGTGQPNGIMGGPEHGLCSYCSGTGRRSAASAEPAVAWMSGYADQPGLFESATTSAITADDWRRYGRVVIPLYAAPPSPVVSEEMVRRGIEAYEHLIETWPGEDGPGDEVRVRIILNAALSHAPAGEAGWRTRFVTWLEGEIAELERMIDKGQGEHGKPGYVREAIWHAWHGRLSALRSARHQLPALPASPTGGDKP